MATLSAKETARELGTDPRTFRKFMRSILPKEEQPGQGNRYSIEARSIKKLKKQFDEWNAPKAKAVDNGEAVEVLDDEELEDMMISDDEDFVDEATDEPTDEEIDEIAGEEDFDLSDLEEL